MNKNEGITVDTLFVGPTRPTTYWGVTWQAFILNSICTMETFVWTHNLLWLLLFIPVHGICYLICLHDARAFELLIQWGPTKGCAYLRNFFYWQAASVSPLDIHVGKTPTARSRLRFMKVSAR